MDNISTVIAKYEMVYVPQKNKLHTYYYYYYYLFILFYFIFLFILLWLLLLLLSLLLWRRLTHHCCLVWL